MNTFINLTQAEEDEMIQKEFQALLHDYAGTAHPQKVEIITRAFEFANKAHKGTKRRSGEPYIMHPLSVARIVVKEIGLGSTSICSALLHDVVEDTDYTTEDIQELFGPKIASIVHGLTKISGGIFGDKASEQAENFLHGTRLTASMVSAFIENVYVHEGGRIVVQFKYEQSIQDAVRALHTD